MFLIKKGHFLSDEYWVRVLLKKYDLVKGEDEEDFSFRKRVFQTLWDLSGDLMEAIEFLFGPYKMTEEWTGMEEQKDVAMRLMVEVRENEGDPEEIMKVINRFLPTDPLLAKD